MYIILASNDKYLRKSIASLLVCISDVEIISIVENCKICEEILREKEVDIFIFDARLIDPKSPAVRVPWRILDGRRAHWIVLVDDVYYFPTKDSPAIHFLTRSIVDLEHLQQIIMNIIGNLKKKPAINKATV